MEVTRADQILAQLDVDIAAELGEDVTPEVLEMARAEVTERVPDRAGGHDILFTPKSQYVVEMKSSIFREGRWPGHLHEDARETWLGIVPLLLSPEELTQYIEKAPARPEK